jgi:hypothetical protein
MEAFGMNTAVAEKSTDQILPEHRVASKNLVEQVGIEFLEHLVKFGDTPHIRGFCAYMLDIHRGKI